MNYNALSYAIIAAVLTIVLANDLSLLVTNILLGLIAGKLNQFLNLDKIRITTQIT
ncbi:hypothetical protein [Bacillus piscicola]|uniref:hypothetical protein n=1 Tax=Bacillus piscicola TaxID=1632684 RepID=UPI001F09F629|nr:hypothetical protein [Bacillus piscicola]